MGAPRHVEDKVGQGGAHHDDLPARRSDEVYTFLLSYDMVVEEGSEVGMENFALAEAEEEPSPSGLNQENQLSTLKSSYGAQ